MTTDATGLYAQRRLNIDLSFQTTFSLIKKDFNIPDDILHVWPSDNRNLWNFSAFYG